MKFHWKFSNQEKEQRLPISSLLSINKKKKAPFFQFHCDTEIHIFLLLQCW